MFEYFTAWPLGVVRLGVVLCVALAAVYGAKSFDDTMRLFDARADQNASAGYLDRLYGKAFNAVGSQTVLEDARLWMPDDAEYRVVGGSISEVESGLTTADASEFVEFMLLPRRRTESAEAHWVFCYGCVESDFPDGFEPLSDGGNGIVFGRIRP